ncbi:MAG: FAA hydrolase family protein, partial [Achromobacter piechaudii]
MRLVTFRAHPAAAARLGALAEGYVIDLALLGRAGGVDLPDDMLAFIDLGPVAVEQARRLMEAYQGEWPVGTALPQENVKLLAPIPRPRKNIFGIGLN